MALNIPKNKIIQNKYTSGGEYVTDKEYKEYKGYYYELNNKVYAGKEFNISASVLIKADSKEINRLITNPLTSLYGAVYGGRIPQSDITSVPFTGEEKIRYFIKKINVVPSVIKEISGDNFQQVKTDPLYQSIEVNFKYSMTDAELDNLDKQMPGIKAYLQLDLIPNTSGDENNPYIS